MGTGFGSQSGGYRFAALLQRIHDGDFAYNGFVFLSIRTQRTSGNN
jgi:hypothetical protein